MKRPSMFKVAQKSPGTDIRGRPRPSHGGRDSPVIKSIKKMRIRNRKRGEGDEDRTVEASPQHISEAVTTLKPRLSSRRKASLSSQRSSFRKPEETTRRLALSTRKQTTETETESASSSPLVTSASTGPASSEAPITVSPAAHIIRYTLDSSEVTSELSTKADTDIQTENLTPRAEKLVASMAIPSDIFRSVK